MRHDAIESQNLAPATNANGAKIFDRLYEIIPNGSPLAGIAVVDAEYSMNLKIASLPDIVEN